MSWYVGQLWAQLLLAALVGLLAGWVLWRWGWQKTSLTQEYEVTRLRSDVAHSRRERDALQAELVALRAAGDGAPRTLVGSASAVDSTAELAACASRIADLEAALADCTHARDHARGLVADMNADPDDLKVIEGIGPKMEQALNASGIRTFARLARSDEPTLRAAIEKAGMPFAPSLVTWAEQASYLERGDHEGFKALTDSLVAGRAPEKG